MSTTTLKGYEALAYATQFGLTLTKAADPVSPHEEGITPEDARAILAEDPSLISIEAPSFDYERITATHAAIGNDGCEPVVWGLGDSPEMAFADALSQDGFDVEDAPYLTLVDAPPDLQARVQSGDVSFG